MQKLLYNITSMTRRRSRATSRNSFSNLKIFGKRGRDASARERTEKKSSKKNENESFKKMKKKEDRWMNFLSLFDVYINRFKKCVLNVKCNHFIIVNISCDAIKELITYIIAKVIRRRCDCNCRYIFKRDNLTIYPRKENYIR